MTTFKQFIKEHVEQRVKSVPTIFKKGCKDEDVEIACIFFGYNNGPVIEKLKERGSYYVNNQMEELEKVDE